MIGRASGKSKRAAATSGTGPRARRLGATMPQPHVPPVKIAITGGPHSGKTTLLAELAARGFAVVPEAAISVIEELVAELGRDRARAWRLTHVPQFQERIAQRQLQLEYAARQESAAAVFCDRGLVDGLAYMRLAGAPPTPFVKAAVASSRYDLIVLCEICLPFKPRIETGRTSDLRRAREIEASLVVTYREFGYHLLRLPAEATVASRADLLLEELSRHGLVARTR